MPVKRKSLGAESAAKKNASPNLKDPAAVEDKPHFVKRLTQWQLDCWIWNGACSVHAIIGNVSNGFLILRFLLQCALRGFGQRCFHGAVCLTTCRQNTLMRPGDSLL